MGIALRRYPQLLLFTLLAVSLGASAAELRPDFSHLLEDEPEFLKVDEAFRLSASIDADSAIVATWDIADGYYLYRDRFAFSTRDGASVQLSAAELPAGKKKFDEYFGEVEVYYHQVQARVPFSGDTPGAFEVGITYQGCADRGLCYPPKTQWIALSPDGSSAPVGPATAALSSVESGASRSGPSEAITEEQALASMLAGSTFLVSLAMFFVAGVGLAFTPCVLPMVPILSSIIVGEGGTVTRSRAFTLSLAYVLGMAVTYAALGVVVGLFGASMNLQSALQTPAVLGVFAAIFVLLALSMFGFYELRLPRFLQDTLDAASRRQRGGRHASVLVMGSLSALVVSPCVSAPLAAVLIYLSTTGDAVLGGGALLALGLGMGTPLLAIGASGGHLLPRAGAWMDSVKAVFGVLLLAVAVWLVERVLPPSVSLLLWSALAIASGVYLGALDFSPRRGWGQLWKALGAFAFVYGVVLLIGAALGARDPLAPLAPLVAQGSAGDSERIDAAAVWRPIDGDAGLKSALADSSAVGRPVVLDFYADWCIACKVMERQVFHAPEVQQRLARFELLRADVTENDEADQALLESLRLFGPPSLVFFDAGGEEVTAFRIQGEMGRSQFIEHLDRLLVHLESGTL